tara:strand:- start:170 stop:1018 length:849 start_codon:yes stop_codon:yes gene_type:complete
MPVLVKKSKRLKVVLLVFLTWGIGFGSYVPARTAWYWHKRNAITSRAFKVKSETKGNYSINTSQLSYFDLNSEGGLVLIDEKPRLKDDRYKFKRVINPSRTAIVVMDPWIDMASAELNDYHGKVSKQKIIPLAEAASQIGHPIIVLTNDCSKVKYNCRILPELEELERQSKAIILHHSDFNGENFDRFLKSKGIDSLVYTGFSSNMCVIGREMGMIRMKQLNWRIFFIPEASAALERFDTWDTGYIHQATTDIVSQWIAEIVPYSEIMESISLVSESRLTGN